ncbi:MAG: trigger factor [Verrucomicrobia bacterium]|nr:trigger factor [Verrucomicrobiota bacterium]
MNVTVENLAPCKKLVRVDVDSAAVDAAFEATAKTYQSQARLPGFRPGKAPRPLIEKNFAQEIQDEVKRKLIGDSYRRAIDEQKLRVIGYPDIEEIAFGRGQTLQFAATIETAPEFELPEYKGLAVKIETRAVTEEDIQRALQVLQGQRATYNDVAHPVQTGDCVVVNYTGTCDGKPITDLAPAAKGLTEQKNFWMHVEKDSFIPGFTEQLVSAQAGEKRTVNVDFPAEFVTPQVAGKKGVYEIEIVQVKERVLPELTDEFAKQFGAESLEKMREGVRNDLENELKHKRNTSIRNQLVGELLKRVTCELPESVVHNETRNVVYDIVRENQQRGVAKESIDEKKDEIYFHANASAKERIKAAFLLGRIAENEKILVTREEITQRILFLASQYQVKPDKFIKQLQERDGITEIQEQILTSKVIDFLQLHAKIEETPAAPAA